MYKIFVAIFLSTVCSSIAYAKASDPVYQSPGINIKFVRTHVGSSTATQFYSETNPDQMRFIRKIFISNASNKYTVRIMTTSVFDVAYPTMTPSFTLNVSTVTNSTFESFIKTTDYFLINTATTSEKSYIEGYVEKEQ